MVRVMMSNNPIFIIKAILIIYPHIITISYTPISGFYGRSLGTTNSFEALFKANLKDWY